MKVPSLLILATTLATTAAFADSPSTMSDRTDPQAMAAALLSPPQTPISATSRSQLPVESSMWDAHARAAALLSSQRAEGAKTSAPVSQAMVAHTDAHEHAAALLSGYRPL
jgi:hypothetical protein